MLYRILVDIITNKIYLDAGDTPETMQAKLDVFLAKNRIKLERYNELSDVLKKQKDEENSNHANQ